MEPAYRSGDRLVTFNWSSISDGDVIVFKLGSTLFVKRVSKISGNLYFVGGDNKKLSTKFKPIKHNQIIGKVIFKY